MGLLSSSPSAVHLLVCGCNGIPSTAYRPLVKRLVKAEPLFASASYAHPEQYIVGAGSWDRALAHVADAARHAAQESGLPVVGIGHSLGGALIYGAAGRCAAFDTFVLWDPPLFNPGLRVLIALLHFCPSGLQERLPMVRKALRRPDAFGSDADLEAWCRKRQLYRSFHDEVLGELLRTGVVRLEDGRAGWAFPAVAEAEFFLRTPPDVEDFLPETLCRWLGINHVAQYGPANARKGGFVVSTGPGALSVRHEKFLRKRLACGESPLEFVSVSDGHFHPLQDPDDAAELLLRLLVGDGG